MKKILKADFFDKPTVAVAEKLLGKFLVRRHGCTLKRYMITEVEAYDGFHDKASHAHLGRTERTEVMFGPPGYWYVYFTYGMYWMLNAVVGSKGYPAAILIRGVDGISGPGRLTRALGIDRRLNKKPIVVNSGLYIEDDGYIVKKSYIKRLNRVGVDYAGKYWARRKYRFVLKPNL